jgi:2-phospho-L-lactate guanylyltransferase
VPARAFGQGKTRLAPVLDRDQRRSLSRRWFSQVVRAARSAAGANRTVVVSRSGEALGRARRLGARALKERGAGLNAAAHQGAAFALRRRALGVIVVHADLPRLEARDLRCLMHALMRHPGAALAPDRHGEGTNALALRSRRGFHYRFGAGSFRNHLAEARSVRLRARVIRRAGLADDVDTPEDYALA